MLTRWIVLISLLVPTLAQAAASIVPAFGLISSAGSASISASKQGTNTLEVKGTGGVTISLTKPSSKPTITIGIASDSSIVRTSGVQSIGDIKTFTSQVKAPDILMTGVLGPWVDARAYATLADANTAAVNAGKQLVVSTIYTTVPTTLTANVKIIPGGQLNGSGTVTISGDFEGHTDCFGANQTVAGLKLARPEWWGALGDGTTVDSAAINSALTSSKVVYLSRTAASYVVDGTAPLVLASGNSLISNGATLKLKPATYSSTGHVITTAPGQDGSYNAGLAVVSDITISGIKIDGNIANVTGSATGINLYKVLNARVTDCELTNLPGTTGGGYGIIANYSNNVWITRTKVDRTDRQNIAIWETQGAHIDQCDLNSSYLRDNILVSSNTNTTDGGVTHNPSYQGSYATITNTKCTNTNATATHVIRFSGESSGVVENCELTSDNNLHGVYIADVLHHTVHIKNNIIKNCSYGVEVASDTDDDKEQKYISITDNKIVNCTNGVKYSTDGRIKIQGNHITGTTTQPLLVAYAEDKQITGNIISGGNTIISIRAEASGSAIFSDNIVRDMTSATRSVFLIGDSTGYPMVASNVLTQNTADVITGTAGGYFVNNAATIDAFGAYVTSSAYRTIYNAAVPTSSTWLVNDRIIKAPAIVGQPRAWTVTSSGTAGTLNGGSTTADTTASGYDIIVSSATGLSVGNYITVAGIGGTTTKKITGISGTTITVDTAATNTVDDGAVSYVAPTFTSEGNL